MFKTRSTMSRSSRSASAGAPVVERVDAGSVSENLTLFRMKVRGYAAPSQFGEVGFFFAALASLTRVLIDRSTALSRRVIGYPAAAMTIVTGPRGGGRRAEEPSGDAAVRRSAGAPLLTVMFLATHRMLPAGVLARVGPPAGDWGWRLARALAR
jgi:hypothetical protein